MIEPYFETENGKLYNADCYDLYKQIGHVDLVITDPPYEIQTLGKRKIKRPGHGAVPLKYMTDIDSEKLNVGFDMSILDHFRNWFCFCSKDQLPELFKRASVRRWMLLTWLKTNPIPLITHTYLPDTEYIVHSFDTGHLYGKFKDRNRWLMSPIRKNNFDHPTVKPVFVIQKLLELGSERRDMVFDPFIGTGTTAIACEQLGRRWIGIEKSPAYCEIAKQRLIQQSQQTQLF